MTSEETPLLTSEYRQDGDFTEKDIYDRFTDHKKAMILATVSWCGLLPRTFPYFPCALHLIELSTRTSFHLWILHTRRAANREGPQFHRFSGQVKPII